MPAWWGLPAPALILALVQLAKQLGFPRRYAGLLATVIEVAGGAAVSLWGTSATAADIATGMAAGLSAAGLWSTVKSAARAP